MTPAPPGGAAAAVGGAFEADELGEFLGVAHGDPAQEGEVVVGGGELGAGIRAEDEGGDGRGGGVGQVEEVGEDFAGGAVKIRREPLEGGVNGVVDIDLFPRRRQTGVGSRGDDEAMECGGFTTKGE